MILVFDTETTGLPDFKKRSSDPSQPHLVQLALVQYNADGEETEHHSVIIKPDGWQISFNFFFISPSIARAFT